MALGVLVLAPEIKQERDGAILAFAAVVPGGQRLGWIFGFISVVARAVEQERERIVDRRASGGGGAGVTVISALIDQQADAVIMRAALADGIRLIRIVAVTVPE